MSTIKLAGCFIEDGQKRVLLLHRNNGKHVQWEIPGGKIDPGETPKEAATREVKEELGVEVTIQKHLGEKEFTQGETKMHYTWYSAKVVEGTPKIIETETFDDLDYFSMGQMRKIYDELSPNTQNFLGALGGGR